MESTAVQAADIASEPNIEQKSLKFDQELATLVCRYLRLSEHKRTLKEQGIIYLASFCTQRFGVQANWNAKKGHNRADKQRKKIILANTQRQPSSTANKAFKLIAGASRPVLFFAKIAIERRLRQDSQIRTAEEVVVYNYSTKGLVERMDSLVMSLPEKDRNRAARLLEVINLASRRVPKYLLSLVVRFLGRGR